MTSGKKWGLISPLVITASVLLTVFLLRPSPLVRNGICVGVLLALAQSFISTGVMLWAWKKTFFYWVWGGGMLFRMVVFVATAFAAYRIEPHSLVPTLVTLVSATTLFLVIESALFSSKSL